MEKREIRDPRDAEQLNDIADVVRIHRRMAERWSTYVVQSMGRLQSGNLDPTTWLDAYGRLVAESADDVVEAMQASSRIRGTR
jgi:hypothetical protein